ncbi:hypothetical protein OG394_15060 [Kribbella sp. NBC_01245]|uniref:hypothetical protein n=1 Tax=Kribbella sp. NBC_01245 TaxID=2903578 RepID=UPI002E2BD3ED|nr:hypothetical protein [Kribbella sp. NBC_01245]
MKLAELQNTIEHSSAENWSKLSHHGFRYSLHPASISAVGMVELDADFHHTLLTYRDDIDIQVAYGIDQNFAGTGQVQHHAPQFDWAEKFIHPKATVVHVDYLYRGNIVDSIWVLSFDGAWLPFPERSDENPDGQFSGRSLRIARLLQKVDYSVHDFSEQESLMRQSDLPTVED